MHPSPFSLAAEIYAVDFDVCAVEDHWPQLELPNLVIGEAELPSNPLHTKVLEVATNADNQPCLRDLLQNPISITELRRK